MSYHGLGLASGLGARPKWCPTTTYNAENPPKDPCEIRYSVDIPIYGRSDVGIPTDQITNDLMLAAEKQLPQTLDRVLPIVYPKLQPYLDDAFEQVEYAGRNLLQTMVVPEIEKQKAEVIAQAEILRDEALKTLVVVGATLVVAVGLAAWWLKS